jgi:carbon-monoxide dehydrogenase medium subunit
VLENYKTNFEYHAPNDVKETLELLSRYGNDCKLIAGGTDLIPKIKAGIVKFDHLVSLKNNAELRTMSFDLNGGLTIGACVNLMDTEKSGVVRKYYPALYTGIHCMANTQIRNRGTVTGNICNAVPSADAAPPLIVYGAKVKLLSAKAERIVPIEDFFTGVCTTVIEPDELAAAIILPTPKAGSFSVYYKYTIRKALELAMIGVAANVLLDGKKVVTDAKISLGAVAATPKRARNAEKLIIGNELTDELILDAANVASREDCAPISDIRATADYRREMVRAHVRDALRKAVEEK